VSPVKYEMGFYIPEDSIFHSHRCEYLKSYMSFTVSTIALRLWSLEHSIEQRILVAKYYIYISIFLNHIEG
jgi:hypothetical protein